MSKESDVIHRLTRTEGWQLLRKRWLQLKRDKYERLRQYKRDPEFYQAQGYLDAIDDMFREVEQVITDVLEEE